MDPILLSAYVDLGLKLEGIAKSFWDSLRAKGVTDEQIAAHRADLEQRIARREAETAPVDVPLTPPPDPTLGDA